MSFDLMNLAFKGIMKLEIGTQMAERSRVFPNLEEM